MIIEQIIDKSSYGILEYASQLNKEINSKTGLKGAIKNYNEGLIEESIKIFHFSNSTRRVILPLMKSRKSNNFIIIHDILTRNKLIRIINHILYRLLLKKSGKLIVHSKFAKNLLCNNYGFIPSNYVKVIPHGTFKNVRTNTFKTKKRYGLKEKDFVVLILGKINKARGQFKIINQIKDCNDLKVKFIIAGQCLDKEFIKEISKITNVKYLGYISNKMLREVYSISSCLLIYRDNSVGESSGAISYAQGYGMPIIASEIGSFKESIADSGICFNNNQFKLREIIQNIRSNYKIFSKNASEIALKNSWRNFLNKIIKNE